MPGFFELGTHSFLTFSVDPTNYCVVNFEQVLNCHLKAARARSSVLEMVPVLELSELLSLMDYLQEPLELN